MVKKHILLFPGGMKPFHDGHFSIIDKYIQHYQTIDEVIIIISKKPRENITANSTLDFLTNIKQTLIEKYNINFSIFITDAPSPIMQCYRIVGNSKDNDVFCLVSSNKDNDSRITNFINDWSINGKYYKGVNKIFNVNINNEPVLYERDDEYNNKPISSTILRNDLNTKNFDTFITSYKIMLQNNIVNIVQLYNYYNMLLNEYI